VSEREGGKVMETMQRTYRELIEERAYWKMLLERAKAQGQTGETFVKCIKATNADLLSHNYRAA
jgi:hypothetical protein